MTEHTPRHRRALAARRGRTHRLRQFAGAALAALAISSPAVGDAPSRPLTSNGWTTSAAATPATVRPGATISITVDVRSATDRRAGVRVQTLSGGTRVLQRSWSGMSFRATRSRTFTLQWRVPRDARGRYVVSVQVFTPDWRRLQSSNPDATTFVVAAAPEPTVTTAPATTVRPGTTVAPPTTTRPPTTTTRPPTTTTRPPTTTTRPPTTTTTRPPTTTAPPSTSAPPPAATGCVFSSATGPINVAFCDTFDRATPSPGTRAGDLDATIWGVSRTNTITNWTQGEVNRFFAATLRGCGAPRLVLPPDDVRICDGRLVEAVQDGSGQSTLAMYPKQPLDIAGRTGTAVFDVSADSDGPHHAWPEFWWTDQPVPSPHGSLSSSQPYARNSVGFSIALDCSPTETGIDAIMITRNHRLESVPFEHGACVEKGSVDGALNHFEVRMSETRIEIWGTDAGSSRLQLMASANVTMPMTRGVIWVEDVHYNACKAGFGSDQCDHTFAWDNVGFDGPEPYRDMTFDVPDAGVRAGSGMNLGYAVGAGVTTVTAPGVHWLRTPTQAYIGFNWFSWEPSVPRVRVNGGPWHETAWPFDSTSWVWRTIAVPVPMSEIRTGDNVIEMSMGGSGAAVANINVILINASPVP